MVKPVKNTNSPLLANFIKMSMITISYIEVTLVNGEINCIVNRKKLQPLDFSLDLIKKIFPVYGKKKTIFHLELKEYTLPNCFVEGYFEEQDSNNSNVTNGYLKLTSSKKPRQGKSILICEKQIKQNNVDSEVITPKSYLYEIRVTQDLYTYIFAFNDSSYIRTPLVKRITK